MANLVKLKHNNKCVDAGKPVHLSLNKRQGCLIEDLNKIVAQRSLQTLRHEVGVEYLGLEVSLDVEEPCKHFEGFNDTLEDVVRHEVNYLVLLFAHELAILAEVVGGLFALQVQEL
jgi:hypothetical protein